VRQVTDLERQIIDMRYINGLYSKQIAEKLGLTIHQVKYRLRKPSVKKYIHDVTMPKTVKAGFRANRTASG